MKKTIILLLIVFSLGFIIGLSFRYKQAISIPQEVEAAVNLSRKEFVKAEIGISPGKIMLRSDCSELHIYTSRKQTESIRRALAGEGGRPLAHDLLRDIIKEFQIELLQARIWKIEKNIYYARLILKLRNSIIDLDARPSDSIAIAARLGKPVLVKRSLLREYGKIIC